MLNQTVVKLGLDICHALGQRKDIHGAIKESNVSLVDGAYVLGPANESGMLCGGDISCMAPEIYWGEGCDQKADIYALGLLMYAKLNDGCLPLIEPGFDEKQRRDAHLRRLEGEAFSPSRRGNPALQQVVMKACAYEPIHRYADISELEQALQEVV